MLPERSPEKIIAGYGECRSFTWLSMNNIEDAVANLSIQRYRVVAISSYSAMFHAARAILFRDGIKERSHECIAVYLKEKYPELRPTPIFLTHAEDSGTMQFMGLILSWMRKKHKLRWIPQRNSWKK